MEAVPSPIRRMVTNISREAYASPFFTCEMGMVWPYGRMAGIGAELE